MKQSDIKMVLNLHRRGRTGAQRLLRAPAPALAPSVHNRCKCFKTILIQW
jgi:hypothetical protein